MQRAEAAGVYCANRLLEVLVMVVLMSSEGAAGECKRIMFSCSWRWRGVCKPLPAGHRDTQHVGRPSATTLVSLIVSIR